jgi:hypothetical protein
MRNENKIVSTEFVLNKSIEPATAYSGMLFLGRKGFSPSLGSKFFDRLRWSSARCSSLAKSTVRKVGISTTARSDRQSARLPSSMTAGGVFQ